MPVTCWCQARGAVGSGRQDKHSCRPPIEKVIAYAVDRMPSTLARATAWVRLLTSSFE